MYFIITSWNKLNKSDDLEENVEFVKSPEKLMSSQIWVTRKTTCKGIISNHYTMPIHAQKYF